MSVQPVRNTFTEHPDLWRFESIFALARTMEAATRLRDPHAETPQSLFPQKEFDASQ